MKRFLTGTVIFLLSIGNVFCQEKLQSDGQIPLLAWWSIPAGETTLARYQELKDAGITISFSPLPSADEVQKALDIAAKAGVKLMISCPELKSEPEKTVKRFMNHPAIAGYHLMDEPSMVLYPELGSWAKKIQSIDNKHFCYVNLFPMFADTARLGTGSYRKYVSECAKQIPLQFLSFDFYPVLKESLIPTWYDCLEQFADESKKAGKPFWAFTLSTNFDDRHLTPQTLASMRLQVYSDLAYGAQGIQYFTYWSATSIDKPSGEDQRGAPLSAAGKRSVVYDRVKLMSQEIKNLSGVFLGSKVVMVRHTGLGAIPKGTVRLTTLPKAIKAFDTAGAPALVSVLEKGENSFLVVVNKDFLNSINLTVVGDESVKKVLKDGTIVPASVYESSLELEPGDAAIFMFPTEKK